MKKWQKKASVILAVISFYSSWIAHAGVNHHEEVDELNNETTYYVTITSSDHKAYTAENYLFFICHPTGEFHLLWHKGRRYTGFLPDEREIQYKFVDG